MNCDQVKDNIADYLAGVVSPTAAEELDEHMAGCAACKQETEALSETWEMLGLLEQEQPSAAMRPRFYQSLEAYRQGLEAAAPAAAKRRFFDWGWQGWAWSAALLVGGFGGRAMVGPRECGPSGLGRLQGGRNKIPGMGALPLVRLRNAHETV